MVVHMAAQMDFFPKDVNKLFQTNVQGTKNLVKAFYNQGGREFVMVSSTEAIGSHKDQANEETKLEPNYEYGKSKVECEKWIAKFQKKNPDFKYTILRPTGIFGPYDTAAIYQLLVSINFGLFFFAPKDTGLSQWIHVDDVVSAVIAAMEAEKKKSNFYYLYGR